MKLTATQLIKDVYHVLDKVIETGIPAKIERKGQLLQIIPMIKTNKVMSLKAIPNLINGDPASLEDIDWSGKYK